MGTQQWHILVFYLLKLNTMLHCDDKAARHIMYMSNWAPFLIFQVWFQNRRAKFRRNERAMLASKNASLLKSFSGEVTAVEQPIVPRPAPRPNDYLSWGSSPSYRLEVHLIFLWCCFHWLCISYTNILGYESGRHLHNVAAPHLTKNVNESGILVNKCLKYSTIPPFQM